MARKPHLKGISQHTAISRVLSALLLVFVIYGTTIEAAHRHGRILSSETSQASSVSENQNSEDFGSRSMSCAECLICQLHQHFSTSLLTVWDDSAPTQTSSEVFRSAAAIILTRSNAPNPGRAPPITS